MSERSFVDFESNESACLQNTSLARVASQMGLTTFTVCMKAAKKPQEHILLYISFKHAMLERPPRPV